jgi:hypothetical protein
MVLYSQDFQLAQPVDCRLVDTRQSVVVELPAKTERAASDPRYQETRPDYYKYHKKELSSKYFVHLEG